MPLSADAQALLELVLAKGQSYEDLAGLLDVPEAEVRDRAREALSELAGGANPDRNVALTDYLLGQADPIDRAEVARHLREDPEDGRLAAELLDALQGIAPEAELPRLPGAPGGGRRARRPAKPPKARKTPSRAALESHQTRLLVVLGSAAVLLVAIVLGITGAFGGSDDESSGSTGSEGTTTADAPAQDIETVPLEPSGGGDARGVANFGIASGQAFVDLEIQNLERAPQGEAYILWLMISEEQGHPLTPFQVNQNGTYSERIPIASFLTDLASRTQLVDVSLSKSKPLLAEVEDAVTAGSPIIEYTGDTILRGVVPGAGSQAGGAQGGGAEGAQQPEGG